MKLVVQRVKSAKVEVDEKIVGKIDKGFLVLLGITSTDTESVADYLVKKLCNLRIFEDENEKMNLSIKDVNREIINCISIYLICRYIKREQTIFYKCCKT